ncbi:MAG: SAM-dependent methyltransferase [Gammaproteobacteria bacterium]|nr:SAM-dependent methyltransferase [Gammaproteobacteria bacterium]MCY4227578.1 SAM-dependent methyltransferase [Gammaproteobacteria bacterium]
MTQVSQARAGRDTHSSRVVQRIHALIHECGGWIGFDQYMHEALHSPGYGYYSTGTVKLGADGDYITAPMLGNAFAGCLARQYQQIRENLTYPESAIILEFGAGTGQLALDMLAYLAHESALPKRYMILETSGDLVERQRALLEKSAPEFLSIVEWVHDIPDNIIGMVIANEVLDAMPVKRFRVRDSDRIVELGVGLDQGLLGWKEGAPLEGKMLARLREWDLPAAYQGELGLQTEYWTASLVQALEEGVVIIVDYGFARHEYFHPDRTDGTIMCHYRHESNMDPFLRPGLQDITAHVDFTAIAEAGRQAGADIAGFSSQACFLIANGILDLAPSEFEAPSKQMLEITQQIKKLTLPHEMGELFKVLALSKNYPCRLAGFSFKDIRDCL